MAKIAFASLTTRARLDANCDANATELIGYANWLQRRGYIVYEIVQSANKSWLSTWPNKLMLSEDDATAYDQLIASDIEELILPLHQPISWQKRNYGEILPQTEQILKLLPQLAKAGIKLTFKLYDPREYFVQIAYELAELGISQLAELMLPAKPIGNVAKLCEAKLFNSYSLAPIGYTAEVMLATPMALHLAEESVRLIGKDDSYAGNRQYGCCYAGYDWSDQRMATLKPWLDQFSKQSAGIGPSEPYLPSLSNNKPCNSSWQIATLSQLGDMFPILLTDSHNWPTPRFWQGLCFGCHMLISYADYKKLSWALNRFGDVMLLAHAICYKDGDAKIKHELWLNNSAYRKLVLENQFAYALQVLEYCNEL